MSKIKVSFISFPFSEAPGFSESFRKNKFKSFEEAQSWLNRQENPDLGYYKTDFEIHFEDGEIYKGRYDIGSDEPTLREHVLRHVKLCAGIRPMDFDQNRFGFLMKRISDEEKKSYQEFLDKYDIQF